MSNWLIDYNKKFPCITIGCDGSGHVQSQIAEDEYDYDKCQYCYEIRFPQKEFIGSLISQAITKEREEHKITGETSDGYHNFNELYEFRKIFNATLFNEWSSQEKCFVHKSKKHNDGELCFGGGWFIVMATPPTGQISNHYELKDWDLFHCQEREVADKWDGHTAKDVVNRLVELETKTNTK